MKLFFDNNLPRKLARVLTTLDCDAVHIAESGDLFSHDTPDDEWFQSLDSYSHRPLVFTCDRDVERNPHIRATFLRTSLIVFCFDAEFARFPPITQAAMLLWNMPEILVWEAKTGPRIIVVRAIHGRAKLKFIPM